MSLTRCTAADRARYRTFIGEVVDVTGHLGGFNFQWAWSSGVAAGRYVRGPEA
jgi:predicted flavoprotein YhiN